MKKAIENYNNIRISNNKDSIKLDENPSATAITSKRFIFKSKTEKNLNNNNNKISSAIKPSQSTVNLIHNTKFILKKPKNNNNSGQDSVENFNLRNSFDEGNEDFNVFNLNQQTNNLSIKKISNTHDSQLSSLSALSNSASISMTSLENDSKLESQTSNKKQAEINTNESISKKVKITKSHSNNCNLSNDDDEDLDKVKKFVLIKKTSASILNREDNEDQKNDSNFNINKPTIFKHKIFNSKDKQYSNKTNNKNLKFSSFKLDFNNQEEINLDSNHQIHFKNEDLTNKDFIPETSLLEVNLQNSRKPYECEELGEAQAFLDDFNYLIDGVNSKYKLIDRCLSSIKLAEQCFSSEFRMNLRSNEEHCINLIFRLLSDSVKFKSLSLCTSLIIFALTQDKFMLYLDSLNFNLIISILNLNDDDIIFNSETELLDKLSYLNDLNNTLSSSIESPKASNELNNDLHQNDNNDEHVYNKIYKKCKKLFVDFNESLKDLENNEINFNSKLLCMDSLLNLNQNMKKTLIMNDAYKNELCKNKILDLVLYRIKIILFNIKSVNDDSLIVYLLSKFKSCLDLLATLTQSTSSFSNCNFKNKPIKNDQHEDDSKQIKTSNLNKLSGFVLIQNYLINFKQTFLIELVKESLNHFYDQLIAKNLQKQKETNNKTSFMLLANCIKEIFLLLINLTHNNEYTSKKLVSDSEFLDLIFNFLDFYHESLYSNYTEKFDLLVMCLSVLLNLQVNCFKQKVSTNLINYRNKNSNLTSIDIILNLYNDKADLIKLAENNHEKEYKQLNEQLESQNMENINLFLMNSIHKAGKHMEDHIIAAHSALIIGYMLLNDQYLNDKFLIDTYLVKSKVKDNSFKYMVEVIKKFIAFINMMKVSGFSAEEHITVILNYLENLDN